MKSFLRTSLILALAAGSFQLSHAQDQEASSGDSEATDIKSRYKMNMLKVNLPALVLKNYSLQYERILGRSTSIALAVRTMPTTSLPLKGVILDLVDDDKETTDALNKLRLSNFAITPELRWYLGSGYGRGFYIAPYYRYAKFKTNDITVNYENDTESIALAGEHSSHSGGLLFGAQWLLGKSISLDWWILGAHIGSGDGNFTGTTSHTLTSQEQQSLRDALEDIDIPYGKTAVSVTANGASLRQTGFWGGIRAGLSLGFRF